MQALDAFTVTSHQAEPKPSIHLRCQEDSVSVRLNAAALLSQYRCPTGDVLLVLDDDCPFEEQLHLVLMRGSSVLDHVVIGAPYTAGQYRLVETGADLLRFRFEGEAVWTVRVHAEGTRGLGGLPSGARRETGWLNRRYLTLTWNEAG